MEDYTYHFGPGAPKVLGAHMLEVCPSITTDRPTLEIHPLALVAGGSGAPRLPGDAGERLRRRLIDLGDRFRMVANDVTIVAPDEPLPKLPVACAVWQPAPDLATSAEAWLLAGGPHHTVLTTGVDKETLQDFALMSGVELVQVDSESTVARVGHELRWNMAYYRLAQGL